MLSDVVDQTLGNHISLLQLNDRPYEFILSDANCIGDRNFSQNILVEISKKFDAAGIESDVFREI